MMQTAVDSNSRNFNTKEIMAESNEAMIMMVSSDEDSTVSEPAKKKKKYKSGKATTSNEIMVTLQKKYPHVFIKLNKSCVKCTTCSCKVSLASGIKDVERHLSTQKHLQMVKSAKGQRSLFNVGVSTTSMSAEEQKHQSAVFHSELLLSAHVAQNNISFAESTHLVK